MLLLLLLMLLDWRIQAMPASHQVQSLHLRSDAEVFYATLVFARHVIIYGGAD